MKSKITKDQIAKVTASFLQDKAIYDMIMFCDITPTKAKPKVLNPVISWTDSFGCSISFNKKTITYSNLEKPINQDMYSGLSLEKILKITDKICIVKGIDEDYLKPFIYYNCLCVDNKIRSYLIYNDNLYKTSPLYLGYDNLYEFVRNKNIIHWYSKDSDIFIPCINQKIYYSSYPLPEAVLKELG